MSGHSLLSPSGAHRWKRCPASLRRSKDYGRKSSVFADEGTLAHDLASTILLGQKEPKGIPDDMRAPVQVYIDTVKTLTEGAEQIWVEEKLDLSNILGPGEAGTGDHVAVVPVGDGCYDLFVSDLKYGRGVEVIAEDNEQLILYGLGAMDLVELVYDQIRSVHLVIHQPRLYSVSEKIYTVEEMNIFREEIKKAAETVLKIYKRKKEPTFSEYCPGEKQCRFCPAKFECEALLKTNLETVIGEFDTFPTSSELTEKVKKSTAAIPLFTPHALGSVLDNLDLLSTWLSGIKSRAHELLLQGAEIPGWKLVEGRAGNRAWAEEESVEKLLKSLELKEEEMYKKKLISPTDAEKLLKKEGTKWEKVTPHITRSAPQPTIVPNSDKRPPLVITPTVDEFDDLTTKTGV